jgi:hypothetical protein
MLSVSHIRLPKKRVGVPAFDTRLPKKRVGVPALLSRFEKKRLCPTVKKHAIK